MKWFLNLKISSKLLAAFLIIAVFAAIAGGVGIINLTSVKAADSDLYRYNALALQHSGKTAVNILQLQFNVLQYRYASTPSAAEEIKNLIAEYQNSVGADIANLVENIKANPDAGDELKGLADSMNDAWSGYNENLNTFFQYIDEGLLGKSIEQREALTKTGEAIRDMILQSMSMISVEAEEKASANARKSDMAIYIMPLTMVVVIAVSVVLGIFIAGIIGKPIVTMTKLAALLASGDINTDKVLTRKDMKLKDRRDEIGDLSNAFHKLIVATKKQVKTAQLVAAGDLTANVELRSEFDVLGKTLSTLVDNLNGMVLAIVGAAEQVSAGAAALSDSSMSLSQGATEQASSVEQLTASLENIASQTSRNAQNAEMANKLANNAKAHADKGNEHMKDMLNAMDEINGSSKNINKIIKVIDDIAFQTNILALNAAVEAARAGQHGLGFAVVAEEVRTLAAKSASAASETTELIENSIKKVKAGTAIANETAKALSTIVEEVEKAAKLVAAIATASKEQAAAIEQINQGIIQVSQVVQANAATSEESAAASQELSGQAAQLKEIVGAFKIRGTKDGEGADSQFAEA
jgi:methyl-accepting chemotaxis protein